MIRVKPSLSILLEDIPSVAYKPDAYREIPPIIPYSETEGLVALRGLGRHIDILYKGVHKKTLSREVALFAVYNFFVDGVDAYRQTAQNAISALNQEESHAYFAPIIAATRQGFIARREGKWHRGKERERQLVSLMEQTLGFDDEISEGMRQWALRSAKNNRMFWFKQLEANRNHPVVLSLAEAIDAQQYDEAA